MKRPAIYAWLMVLLVFSLVLSACAPAATPAPAPAAEQPAAVEEQRHRLVVTMSWFQRTWVIPILIPQTKAHRKLRKNSASL
jgi:ABC-type uncharacterized transport system auxiliary subunit